jgi:hypothetical protein
MSVFDLSGVIQTLATHTIAVTRYTPDSFDAQGRALTRTVAGTFNTIAVVTPDPSEKLKRDDPSGFNPSGKIQILSPVTLQNRDRVDVPGWAAFEVEEVGGWEAAGNYCAAIARKINVPYEPN